MYKFNYTGESKEIDGHLVYRICAQKDFGNVHAGDIGGFIESIYNLDPFGKSWVGEEACVYGHAVVKDDAYVGGTAVVGDNAVIADSSLVHGDAKIGGDSHLGKDTCMVFGLSYGDKSRFGTVKLTGNEDLAASKM